jgi:hypothetical protein
MKYFLLLLAVPALMSETCKEKKEAREAALIPACIQNKIDSIGKEPRWNPPAEVNEYSYKDKRVFLFSSDCCDFFNIAVDANCNYVCAPSGGITGKGDMQCTDFSEKAKFIKLVWKDPR